MADQGPANLAADPFAMLRTRSYVTLLVFAALIGVPIAIGAYYFLTLVDNLQTWVFTDLPDGLGFDTVPTWWPVLPLVVAGLIVGAVIQYLPGGGGHSPADGFKTGAPAKNIELPGILLASLAGLGLGVVIGPEAPLIALGGGVAALLIRLAKKDAPAQTVAVVGAAGSFAAVSALLGNPLLGAFLFMEMLGLGGAMATLVLLPGLLAAGIGALVFIGLGTSTGVGEFSLVVPNLPPFDHPDASEFLWAFAIGVAAAVVGTAIRWLALQLRPHVERRLLLLTPVVGLVIAALAIAYGELADKNATEVLFSGQTALPELINQSATYSVGALLLLILCKSLAYSASLSSFRGGPIFPAMFIGAAGGIVLSHLPGLNLVAGVAMGIGAMIAVLLRFPLTAVLLATLLLGTDGIGTMPVVIVAVVVAFVVSAWFLPILKLPTAPAPTPAPAPAPASG